MTMDRERSEPFAAGHNLSPPRVSQRLISSAVTAAGAREDEDDDSPAVTDYGDLLDAKWLEREADVLDQDDDLVDVGLTLDLDDDDDDDENAYAVDLDVGSLLTSLQPPGADADSSEPALNDGSLAAGALSEVLLPEANALRRLVEDDEAVGDDEQFPAFDESEGLHQRPAVEDDGSESEE